MLSKKIRYNKAYIFLYEEMKKKKAKYKIEHNIKLKYKWK